MDPLILGDIQSLMNWIFNSPDNIGGRNLSMRETKQHWMKNKPNLKG
jgi:hypothetical protein